MYRGYQRKNLAHTRMFILVAMAMFAVQAVIAAGSGIIRGRVVDGDTKDPLPGANVVVKGYTLGAATDLNGNFVIYNVPAERLTLRVSYIGYVTDSVSVVVSEDQTTTANASLHATAIVSQTVVVTAQAQGQMQAINEQLSSNAIKNVVSEAKIQELPDYNAAEAIGRLPGVSVQRSSGEASKITIRGLSPEYNLVSIEGISIGSTNQYDKSVDLTMISPYMLKAIDVYKALTPDKDANAIGGVVDLQLREAPSGFHSDLMYQEGYTEKNSLYNNFKVMGAVSNRFFDDAFGVYFQASAEKYDRASDNFNGSYTLLSGATAGQQYGQVYVTSMGLNRHLETRSRYGGNLILDYKTGETSISFVNMASRLNSLYHDYTTTYNFGPNADMTFNSTQGNSNTDLLLSKLSGSTDFGFMSIDLTGATSYTRNANPEALGFDFDDVDVIHSGGSQAPNVPPERLYQGVVFDTSQLFIQQMNRYAYRFQENDAIASGNVKVPFRLDLADLSGYLKFGGKYIRYTRSYDENDPYAQMRWQGNQIVPVLVGLYPQWAPMYDATTQNLQSYGFTNPDNSLYGNFLGGRFGGMVWVPNTPFLGETLRYIASNLSTNSRWYSGAYEMLRNDYEDVETYSAGYGMTELNIGQHVLIVGGARFEQDRSDFSAYYVKATQDWTQSRATAVDVKPINKFWLPMVQTKVDVADWADLRYAYTQTLSRPKFGEMSPYTNMDYNGQYVSAGNPKLRPMHAYNHDLMLTIHSNDIGLFSVGAFYKEIKDFSYYIDYTLSDSTTIPGYLKNNQVPGAAIGAHYGTFYNNPALAYVRGVEFDFQHRFWYLPAPFDGLILNINYTHLNSATSYPFTVTYTYPPTPPSKKPVKVVSDSSLAGALINQPNDIVNASIGYDFQGFSARLSFFFQGKMLTNAGDSPEYFAYAADYYRADLSIRQKLPIEGLQVFLDINNLNSRSDLSTQQSISGTTNQIFYGLTADLGVRFSL